MPERIGQHRDPSIRRIARGRLEHGTGAHRARDGGIDIVNDDVDMQRRPVPLVAAPVYLLTKQAGTLGAGQPNSSTKSAPKRRPTVSPNASV